MKRALLMVAVLAAVCAHADVMLWQVTNETVREMGGANAADITEARLVALASGQVEGQGSGYILQYAGIDIADTPAMEVTAFNMAEFGKLGLDATALSFYIELWSYGENNPGTLQAYSAAVAYNDIQGFLSSSLTMVNNVWHGSGFRPTPEPTSGVMLLFGLGALALKRKRA